MKTQPRYLSIVPRSGFGPWLALLVSVFVAQLSAFAQSYSIDCFKVSGGGGTSTGGQFSLSGTIGQHVAGGPMTNGQYSVIGGFWVFPQAVKVTGAPTLAIVPATPGFATISWSPATPGFVLQQTPTLSPPAWTNAPSGSQNPVTAPVVVPAQFYRLVKP